MKFVTVRKFGLILPLVFNSLVATNVNAAPGESSFKRYCSVCHSVDPGKNKIGPNLAGIVGRHAGSIENFNYSAAMKKLNVNWTVDNLDRFITKPREFVPGTMMAFPGIQDEETRKALVEYLQLAH